MRIIPSIQTRIYEIRGERVMLDKDLAALYKTETKFLNLAVKRNSTRFPADFMFQLTKQEFESLRLQCKTSHSNTPLSLQIETSNSHGGARYLPYAFTEQGVAMLSGILNSEKAISMNIDIMRTFVGIRKIVLNHDDLKNFVCGNLPHSINRTIKRHSRYVYYVSLWLYSLCGEKTPQFKNMYALALYQK